ncbi:MAG: hypothetical protein LBD63_02935, partial [Mycoplasmataceae bacterium]|nr:hypothetical protein [Mycoplasmataceae bacterium]
MKNNHEFNWIKRRYKIYVIGASVLSGVVFSGGGIGIGYAIWANSNQPAPMPAPVTPSISALAEGSLKID